LDSVYTWINDDISPSSLNRLHTPDPAAKLPIRVHACGHYYCQSGYRVERKGLKYLLFVYTVQGKGRLRYRGTETEVSAGQSFFISYDEEHAYRSIGNSWEIKWVRFEAIEGVDYFHSLVEKSRYIQHLYNPFKIEAHLNAIIQHASTASPLTDYVMVEELTSLLTQLYSERYQENRLKLPHSAVAAVQEAAGFIERNFDKEVEIKAIASRHHMDPYAFIRLFKKQTGTTPYEYLLRLRIMRARYLLEETSLSVNEISDRIGFNNVNNFIRKFKNLTAMTPLKYREFNQSK
jgi:AraC family transcriptional regulator